MPVISQTRLQQIPADLDLDQAILVLARERLALQRVKEKRQEAYDQMIQTEEGKRWQSLDATARNIAWRIETLESLIRDRALDCFSKSGEKKPHPAVSIRMRTVLSYDPDRALAWCKVYLPKALSLNRKIFEKHARAVAETHPVPFVEIRKEPQATIARDLSRYLQE